MEICISIDEKNCTALYNSLIQDNDQDIEMECKEGQLVIKIKNAKISSIYNLVDDIIRDYETFKKIYNL
ncbi:KEOPS complex subunit Pcc1 [Ferroplasma sp.]|uniref:KEOPS complex subunit Pcc1 n=1 Tax=Ferroplasma sp. TaxID=2591003 RepID=UPI00307D118F